MTPDSDSNSSSFPCCLPAEKKNILEYMGKFQPPVECFTKISSSVLIRASQVPVLPFKVLCAMKNLLPPSMNLYASKFRKRCEQNHFHKRLAFPTVPRESKVQGNSPTFSFHQSILNMIANCGEHSGHLGPADMTFENTLIKRVSALKPDPFS